MILSNAQTTEQNFFADLPEKQLHAQCPIPGEQQKELTRQLEESDRALLIVETSPVPPLKCCAVLLHTGRTGHQTFDLIIQPIVTVPDPSSPEGVDWVEDGRMIEISCLKAEAKRIIWWLLPRIGSDLLYDFGERFSRPANDNQNCASIRLATRGARFLQQAREQAAARAAAVGGAGR